VGRACREPAKISFVGKKNDPGKKDEKSPRFYHFEGGGEGVRSGELVVGSGNLIIAGGEVTAGPFYFYFASLTVQ